MEPDEVQAIIATLAEQRTSTLESFFNSHGLLAAFKRPDEGWGKEKRINEALAQAEAEGRRVAVLSAARSKFGPTPTPSRKSRATPEQMLENLLHEADLLEPGDLDDAEVLKSRSRMIIEQLFGPGNYTARLDNVRFAGKTSSRDRLDHVSAEATWDDAHRRLVAVLSTALEHVEAFGLPTAQMERGGDENTAPTESREPTESRDKRAVMVVHGRDLEAKTAMFTFLRSLDLQPIEWSQARMATGSGSPYVGQILKAAFEIAQAVVVLLTPDDEAKLREMFLQSDDLEYERNLTPQARPNVLFEAGMAMGASTERTVLVQLGNVRPFSDIGGVHVLRFNGSSQARQNLAQALVSAGSAVSVTGTDWHTAGDFPTR